MSNIDVATAALRLAIEVSNPQTSGKLRQTSQWAEAVFPRSPTGSAAREFLRQVDGIVDRVTDELILRKTIEYDDINRATSEQVLQEIVNCIDMSGKYLIKKRDFAVQNAILPSDISSRFERRLADRWQAIELGGKEASYASAVIGIVSYALLYWMRCLPSYEAGWATLMDGWALLDQTQQMIKEVRRSDVSGEAGSRRILGNQRRDLAAGLGRIELIGLPLEPHLRWVPLEISYLSANVIQPGARPAPLEEVLKKYFTLRTTGLRMLICGKAGSGKTTAAQWIGHRAALRRSPVPVSDHVVPFFIRLRETWISNDILSDRTLLYSKRLREQVGLEWTSECNPKITPLLILDGWDEVPAQFHEKLSAWLQTFIHRYPSSHVIITSRPEAAQEAILDFLPLLRVDVLPLSPDDALQLAERWFDGLADKMHSSGSGDLEAIERGRSEIVKDLRTPAISDMSDSPLITSMLCSLYSDGHSIAPKKKPKLYDLVSAALLNRDIERDIDHGPWELLHEDEKYEIVGAVALAMARAKTYQIPISPVTEEITTEDTPERPTVDDASLIEAIEDALPSLGRPPSEAEIISNGMLERSLIVQRIAANLAEFVHRSFQDYFAAAAYRQSSAVEALLAIAEDDGQLALLPFACHNATRRVTAKILTWLLSEVNSALPSRLRRLLFCIIECLAASTSVDPILRTRAEAEIIRVVPPRDEVEAKSLATLGNAAIPFLERDRMSSDRELAIDCLSRIGTNEALQALARYAAEADEDDVHSLASAWQRLDPIEFAHKVMSRIPRDLNVTIRDERRLAAAVLLQQRMNLKMLKLSFGSTSPDVTTRISKLRQLHIVKCQEVGSLEWTSRCAELRLLAIVESTGLAPLSVVGPTRLWGLHLSNLELPENVAWDNLLGRLPDLRAFNLSSSGVVRTVLHSQDFQAQRNLTTVRIGGSARCDSLEFLQRNKRLRMVEVDWALSDTDVTTLSKCRSIRKLKTRLVGDPAHGLLIGALTNLESLDLAGADDALLHNLTKLQSLSRLHLRDADLGKIEDLHVPSSVRHLTMSNCSTRGGDSTRLITSRSNGLEMLESLEVRNSQLTNLRFLTRIEGLKRLTIEDTGALKTLDGLASVPDGCNVTVTNSSWSLDEEPIEMLLRRKSVNLTYEPAFYADDGQAVS